MACAYRFLLTSGVVSVGRFDLLVIWGHGKHGLEESFFLIIGVVAPAGVNILPVFRNLFPLFGLFFVLAHMSLSIFGGVFPPGSDK